MTGARRYTLNQWRNIFDPGAQQLQQRYVDGDRSLDDYARSIGLANAEALFDAMRRQSRGGYDQRLTAEAIRAYYKQGFTLR